MKKGLSRHTHTRNHDYNTTNGFRIALPKKKRGGHQRYYKDQRHQLVCNNLRAATTLNHQRSYMRIPLSHHNVNGPRAFYDGTNRRVRYIFSRGRLKEGGQRLIFSFISHFYFLLSQNVLFGCCFPPGKEKKGNPDCILAPPTRQRL